MSTDLEDAIGEGLVALGLYAACFESMVLAFRGQTHNYLATHHPESLTQFLRACKTAHGTFEFCGPRLVRLGALAQQDYGALTAIRQRRNQLAHEGYNHVFSLRLEHLEADLAQINRVTASVACWHVPPGQDPQTNDRSPGALTPFHISPALITNLVRMVAVQLVHSRLRPQRSVGDAEAPLAAR